MSTKADENPIATARETEGKKQPVTIAYSLTHGYAKCILPILLHKL